MIDPRLYKAHVNKARAQLNKARAQAQKAERDLSRIKPLYAQNAASQLDLDNATAAYESATAEVIVSEADLTQAELTPWLHSCKLADFRLHLRARRRHRHSRRPVRRQIAPRHCGEKRFRKSRFFDDGSRLSPQQRPQRQPRRCRCETQMEFFRHHYTCRRLGLPHKGLVDFADPQVDPKTGTFSVRAEMPNPDRSLLPGEFTK